VDWVLFLGNYLLRYGIKLLLGGLYLYVRQGLAAKPETIEDSLVVDQDQFFSCLVGGSLLRKP
jgi:hypothetical protein